MSIAWATIEHLHAANRCRALFATHYHELTGLAAILDDLACHTMRVREWKGEAVFLYEVAPGTADRSYGVHVARLAGLPPAVIARAEAVLKTLESEDGGAASSRLANDLPLFSAARPESGGTAAPAEPPPALAELRRDRRRLSHPPRGAGPRLPPESPRRGLTPGRRGRVDAAELTRPSRHERRSLALRYSVGGGALRQSGRMARGRKGKGKEKAGAVAGYEAQLWQAADALRGSMDAAEYKHVVLGLVFLKYVSDAFEDTHARLEGIEHADPEDPDEYRADNVFWVPPEARWTALAAQGRQPDIGRVLEDAMAAVERDNPSLAGVLPRDYAEPRPRLAAAGPS